MEKQKVGSVVDLFCGIGGLSYGFLKEGFDIAAGIDTDETCRYAFEQNNKSKFLSWDVGEISGKKLRNLYV
jgi:DNA (cytosine-5)-methyltransferase 1